MYVHAVAGTHHALVGVAVVMTKGSTAEGCSQTSHACACTSKVTSSCTTPGYGRVCLPTFQALQCTLLQIAALELALADQRLQSILRSRAADSLVG